MKKQANILEYVEKYKYKYGISYADENSSLVKKLSVVTSLVWIYSIAIFTLTVLSFSLNFYGGSMNYSEFSGVYITTIVGLVGLIVAAILYRHKQKIIGLVIATISQLAVLYAHEAISMYGINYFTGFYWKYLIPAIIFSCLAVVIIFVLVRAIIKTNRIYNMLVYALYKKYGSENGEKISEEKWQEFLKEYNPKIENEEK